MTTLAGLSKLTARSFWPLPSKSPTARRNDEISEIRSLCLQAGGVALTRYMDLEDALVAQGVVRR
jgi:hypothetical protein